MNQTGHEFRWIILVFRHWLWLIIALMVLTTFAAYFIIPRIPPVYQASTLLFVEPPQSGGSQSDENSTLMAASRLALTYSEMIKDPTFLDSVIQQLHLATTEGQLANRITVEPIDSTQLIRITVENGSPVQAAAIANHLSQSFVNYVNTTQSDQYELNLARLQKKARDLNTSIKTDQSQIDDLQIQVSSSTNQLSLLQSSLDGTLNDIRLLEQDYADAQLAMTQVTNSVKMVQSAQAPQGLYKLPYNASVLLIVNQPPVNGSSNPFSDHLTDTYAQILLSHDVLQKVITQVNTNQSIDEIQGEISVVPVSNTQLIQVIVKDNNPALAVNLANSLGDVFVQQMQTSLAEPYASQVANIQSRLAAKTAEEGSLQAQIDKVSAAKVQLQNEIDHLDSIVTVNQNAYQNGQDQFQQMQTEGAPKPVFISQPADPPTNTGTNTRLFIGVAGMLGGFIGFIIAFLLEYMDDTIRSVQDIDSALGFDILGRIGLLNDVERRSVDLVNPLSPTSEALSILANNIHFAALNQSAKTLIITSPSAKEGKSLVLANLAVTLARMSQTVVAVDADLRMPALHKLFKLDQGNGLSEALLAENIDGYLKDANVEGLRVLTSGKLSTNPPGEIGSKRMRNLLDTLAQQNDVVLIDCPPVLPVVDASIMASMADGVILLLRINKTRKREIQDTLHRLQQVGAHVIGIVLNGVPASSEQYHAYRAQKGRRKLNPDKLLTGAQKGLNGLSKPLAKKAE